MIPNRVIFIKPNHVNGIASKKPALLGKVVNSYASNSTVKVNRAVTCNNTYIIYCISCNHCGDVVNNILVRPEDHSKIDLGNTEAE